MKDREERPTTDRIVSMSRGMSIEQIAAHFDVTEQTVENILSHQGVSVKAPFLAKETSTGRLIRAYSARSAYLKAQIAGFADWDLIENPTHAETMEALRQEKHPKVAKVSLSKRQDGLGARA